MTMILNGMGRHEHNWWLRYLLILILGLRPNITCICQSYRDYRYFRRDTKLADITWIPGSGGSKRVTGSSNIPIWVSRNEKMKFIYGGSDSILDRLGSIYLIGVSDTYDKCISVGEVSQNDIFKLSNIFVQIDGCGEGVPHTLVDAICSDMEIYISKFFWIKYGFYKISERPVININEFYYINKSDNGYGKITSCVEQRTITNKYLSVICK